MAAIKQRPLLMKIALRLVVFTNFLLCSLTKSPATKTNHSRHFTSEMIHIFNIYIVMLMRI